MSNSPKDTAQEPKNQRTVLLGTFLEKDKDSKIEPTQLEKSSLLAEKDAESLKALAQKVSKKRTTRGGIIKFTSFQGYKVLRSLSSLGAEADIYVISKSGSPECILRLYRDMIEPDAKVLDKLFELRKLLKDRVVLTLQHGFDNETDRYYEIQEFMPLGDLSQHLQKGKLDPDTVRSLARQISQTLDLIHHNGVLHRDIKPSNILVSSAKPLKVILGDFGISSLLANNISIKETRMANTPLYAAPESFADFASAAGDFWSLGVVLLECLTGSNPLEHLSANMVMREICSRGLTVPADLPPDLTNLLRGLLTRDDKRRWRHLELISCLNGNTDVPNFYEGTPLMLPMDLAANPGPLRIDGLDFHTPEEIASHLNTGPRQWDMAKELLARGIIKSWLILNGNNDLAIELELKLTGTPDDNVFFFQRIFLAESPPMYRGMLLNLENLIYLLDNHDKLDFQHKKILEDILEGKLKNFSQIARTQGEPFDELLEAILSYGSKLLRETLVAALVSFEKRDELIWGSSGPPDNKIEAVKFVLNAGCALLSWDYWRYNAYPSAEIPEDYLVELSDPKKYQTTAKKLIESLNDGTFSNRQRIIERKNKEKSPTNLNLTSKKGSINYLDDA
ncbi:MAG: protein kinase [Deltaproteobacteria bacterium]|jgi:serine/threonine protein kinase|nr:protein kinase [Deltaproteobacteria bacterium]